LTKLIATDSGTTVQKNSKRLLPIKKTATATENCDYNEISIEMIIFAPQHNTQQQ
jgi:hypothetical protein